MATRSSRRKKNTITVDMSGYDPEGSDYGSGQGGFHIPNGVYGMKCESVEQKTSKSSDNEMLEWVFVGTSGKAKGKKFYFYTTFDDKQKLGKTFKALGQDADDGDTEYDLDEAVDAECFGEVYTDTYNGEKRSKLRKVMLEEEEAGEEEEEEEKTTSRRSNGRATKKRVVKVGEDEVKAMDEDELEELLGKHDLEVDLSKAKTLSKKRNAVLEALGEADLLS